MLYCVKKRFNYLSHHMVLAMPESLFLVQSLILTDYMAIMINQKRTDFLWHTILCAYSHYAHMRDKINATRILD